MNSTVVYPYCPCDNRRQGGTLSKIVSGARSIIHTIRVHKTSSSRSVNGMLPEAWAQGAYRHHRSMIDVYVHQMSTRL